MFVHVLSMLRKEQKEVPKSIGFSSLIQIPCPEVLVDLYHWLLNHFEPSESTLRLPNGFTFALTDKVVYKIIRIPIG
jgi:hypothetical protein